MKRFLATLLAVMLLASPVRASALTFPWQKTAETEVTEQAANDAAEAVTKGQEAEDSDAEAAEEENGLRPLSYDYDELVVGTTMPMYGAFFTSMWGNGASDLDVRALLHGYNLVEWDSEVSGFRLDPSVVSGNVTRETPAGDHTYTLVLYDDLRYSDGSRVTAWDYAFSFLLRAEPEIQKLGGTPELLDYLTGYQNYVTQREAYVQRVAQNPNLLNTQIPVLSGVHVVSDTQLVITVSNTVLPYFYELSLLDCVPYPISVIAPGCEIDDDGDGVFIRGDFSAGTLRGTILGEDGYMLNPGVTSGPYRLVSYNGEEARFELNEYYKGDSHGARPTIERIIFRQADPETMVEQLMNCEYGLLSRTTNAGLIQEGMSAINEDGRYAAANYPRSGLSFLSFNTKRPAGASEDVRKAIACAIDKEAVAAAAVSNYGLQVDAYYGLGQWMYQLLNGTLGFPVEEPAANATAAQQREYEQSIARWEALEQRMEEFPAYGQDPEEAVRLLVKDGWTLNREGKTFDPEKDDVRCKRIGNEIVPLDLKLLYAESASVGEALSLLVEPLAAVGIGLTVEGTDHLLELYYGQREGDQDMLFLATDFNIIFEPSAQVEPDGDYNYFGVNDRRLYDLAQSMIRTEPGDLLGYCEKWLNFQERFNEIEPAIPIYSNIYFDFYPRVLQEYEVSAYSSWAQAVVPAFLSDIPEEEPEAEEEDVFLD